MNRLESADKYGEREEGPDRQVAEEDEGRHEQTPAEDGDRQEHHAHRSARGDGLAKSCELGVSQAHAAFLMYIPLAGENGRAGKGRRGDWKVYITPLRSK